MIQPATTSQALKLAPATHPTIIIVSGTLGAGKTSLVENLISNSGNPAKEKAVIFNEKFEELAMLDASRMPENISRQTLGGCACCLSREQLTEQVKQFLIGDKKLIIIEQSGSTDGMSLKNLLAHEFGQCALVRHIALLSAKNLGNTDINIPNVSSADAVVLTHSEGNIAPAVSSFVAGIGKQVSFAQFSAGEMNSDVWQGLLVPKNKTSGLSLVSNPVTEIDPEISVRRELVRDALMLGTLILNPMSIGQMRAELPKLLSSCPTTLERAKGWGKDPSGKYFEIQFLRTDDNSGEFALGSLIDKAPVLYGGRPHLMLFAMHAPAIEHFSRIGMPDFSREAVNTAISKYLSINQLDAVLASGKMLPVYSEGDPLAFAVFRMTKNLSNINFTNEQRSEFDVAFNRLLSNFLTWRANVARLIRHESPENHNYQVRCINLGFAMTSYLAGYFKLIPEDVKKQVIEQKPTELLFTALGKTTRLEIGRNQELTPELALDLKNFIFFGIRHWDMNAQIVTSALENLISLARKSNKSSWINGISQIRAELSGNNSIVV